MCASPQQQMSGSAAIKKPIAKKFERELAKLRASGGN
jgi:hypothetical protein